MNQSEFKKVCMEAELVLQLSLRKGLDLVSKEISRRSMTREEKIG